MYTIGKRGAKWNVQIRRSNLPNLSRTFILKTDAEKWAIAMEAALDRGETSHSYSAKNITFTYILNKYLDEIIAHQLFSYPSYWASML